MSFTKPTVRIVVVEPFEWNYGNLFGTIVKERDGNKLLVRLTKEIKGNKFSSNIIELTPRFSDETFKPLRQYYSVSIIGSLISEQTKEKDFIIIGHVTYD
jgi:hypothetical protein